jgi:hypothetical protein
LARLGDPASVDMSPYIQLRKRDTAIAQTESTDSEGDSSTAYESSEDVEEGDGEKRGTRRRGYTFSSPKRKRGGERH